MQRRNPFAADCRARFLRGATAGRRGARARARTVKEGPERSQATLAAPSLARTICPRGLPKRTREDHDGGPGRAPLAGRRRTTSTSSRRSRNVVTTRGYRVAVGGSAEEARQRNAEGLTSGRAGRHPPRSGGPRDRPSVGTCVPSAPDLVCVVMTAYADVEECGAALEEGAYHYLRKPIDIRDLLTTLGSMLRKSAARGGEDRRGGGAADPQHGARRGQRRLRQMVEAAKDLASCCGSKTIKSAPAAEAASSWPPRRQPVLRSRRRAGAHVLTRRLPRAAANLASPSAGSAFAVPCPWGVRCRPGHRAGGGCARQRLGWLPRRSLRSSPSAWATRSVRYFAPQQDLAAVHRAGPWSSAQA